MTDEFSSQAETHLGNRSSILFPEESKESAHIHIPMTMTARVGILEKTYSGWMVTL
jgi:hypothetical protein